MQNKIHFEFWGKTDRVSKLEFLGIGLTFLSKKIKSHKKRKIHEKHTCGGSGNF